MWCWAPLADGRLPPIGQCERDVDGCKALRKAAHKLIDTDKCAVHTSAACMRYEEATGIVRSCHVTLTGCVALMNTIAGAVRVLSECEVVD